jgi:tetratricopeptide (TPR) repeat protein
LFFAIHPLQVETVSWVLERRNLLFSLFYFVSLIFYSLSFTSERRRLLLLFSWLAMVGAGMSKGLVFLLPLTMLLVDYLKQRHSLKKLILEKLPFFALAALSFFLSLYAASSQVGGSMPGIRQLHWMQAQYAIAFYFFKTLLPFNLSPIYEVTFRSLPWFWLGPVFCVLTLIIWIKWLSKYRYVNFGLTFFMLNILPVSGLLRVGFALYVCSHFMYIPIFGLLFMLGKGFDELYRAALYPKLLIACLVIIAIVFSFVSHHDSYFWQDSVTLFSRAIEYDSTSRFARNQLGIAYDNKGNQIEAETHHQYVVARYPKFHLGYANLGKLRLDQKRYSESLEYLNRAIFIKPEKSGSYFNRAYAYIGLENYSAAIRDFRKYLQLNPGSDHILFNVGALQRVLGDYDSARKSFEKNLKIVKHKGVFAFTELAGVFVNSGMPYKGLEVLIEGFKTTPEQLGLLLTIEFQKIAFDRKYFIGSLMKNFPGKKFFFSADYPVGVDQESH